MKDSGSFKPSTLGEGLQDLCSGASTQSGEHIKRLHRHLSERLVLEGGFPPEWLLPAPALRSRRIKSQDQIHFDLGAELRSERAVLGGIKQKNIDVTVFDPHIGPALGISAKSTGNAFRNLTNRMEEAVGDCANIHMMYPGFVFGFLHFIRFAREGEVAGPDASFNADGTPLKALQRYHDVLVSLSGRSAAITDAAMRYESVALIVFECRSGVARIHPGFPSTASPACQRQNAASDLVRAPGRLHPRIRCRCGLPVDAAH